MRKLASNFVWTAISSDPKGTGSLLIAEDILATIETPDPDQQSSTAKVIDDSLKKSREHRHETGPPGLGGRSLPLCTYHPVNSSPRPYSHYPSLTDTFNIPPPPLQAATYLSNKFLQTSATFSHLIFKHQHPQSEPTRPFLGTRDG